MTEISEDQTDTTDSSLGHRVVVRLARQRFLTALLALNVGLFFTMALDMLSENQSPHHFAVNSIIMIVLLVVVLWVLVNIARQSE